MKLETTIERLPELISRVVSACLLDQQDLPVVALLAGGGATVAILDLARLEGLPTDTPLSQVTVEAKGHGRYGYWTGKLWETMEVESFSTPEGGVAVVIPSGMTKARTQSSKVISHEALVHYLQEGLGIYPEGSPPPSGVRHLRQVSQESWRKMMAWIFAHVDRLPVVAKRGEGRRAVVIPPRPFFSEPAEEAAVEGAAQGAAYAVKEILPERLSRALSNL